MIFTLAFLLATVAVMVWLWWATEGYEARYEDFAGRFGNDDAYTSI